MRFLLRSEYMTYVILYLNRDIDSRSAFSDSITSPRKPTTKAKGMGLGLPIVKRIIDAHNGEISAKSKSGEGTTFTIRLPIKVPNN